MQIMSTPILLLMNKDKEVKRIYAFKSVTRFVRKFKIVIDEILLRC